jgi:membrane-bound lytic murein transglycosylase A
MEKGHLTVVLTLLVAGCASNNPAMTTTIGPERTSPAATPTSGAASTVSAAPVPEAGIQTALPTALPHATVSAPQARPETPAAAPAAFATRHAYYMPARFVDLPGWNTDDLSASWDALRRSCGVLGSRPGWSQPCTASRSVNSRDAVAVRAFFETYFNAYQIGNIDKTTSGTMTGYYEPLLNGSRKPEGLFVYPVYGVPDDMLYLDSRRLRGGVRGAATMARIDGHTVMPVDEISASGAKQIYILDLRDSVPDIRDKKIRLRLDNNRIVPYYSRAEIERGVLKAPILAYVNDPVALYSMQVQGAGKVRFRDGTIRRLAYAEQNGRPFLPPIARVNSQSRNRIVVRGIDMDIEVDDTSPAAQTAPGEITGGKTATPPSDESADEPTSPLLRGFKLATTIPSNSSPITPTAGHPAGSQSAGTESVSSYPAAPTSPRTFAVSDPSYVFFRVIPDSPNGPIGALGVPLSPGRSVAVDPRTTPLGAPVFVANRDNGSADSINRLMFAQDSGGAIQGAVRADYFYGFGRDAQAQASRTKENIRMWVLLPKGLRIAAQDAAPKTRGLGGPAMSDDDCLVGDPELCVEDAH